MKIQFFLFFLIILSSCDDSDSLSGDYQLLEGNWIIDKIYVNGVESDNVNSIEFEFAESGEAIRIENDNTEIGVWDIRDNRILRIRWEDESTSQYKILKLNSNELEYSFNLDQGIGFPQLELTYSLKKSKSSG